MLLTGFFCYLFWTKKGRLTTKFLISFEPAALEWGEELFVYYKERSKPIIESLSTL
ncbi:transcriptional regulator FilR1 domain-containing protein [Methanosarcina horonobensis]|uniref:transcriptional regulator FilR1 domain-containing protein n=1 Tax=Methanosarcina horonobensis TaxID=418008 RepID=UPI0022B9186A|nr:transcriptional regulator FilR1 domain-containing protein [Methanosarcina horonobensis]